MYIVTSHPSLKDNVSTAIVERATLFSFDELQYNGQVRFFESVKKNICQAWLRPLGKFLKLASIKSWSFTVLKATFGNWIKRRELLTFLIILLTLIMSATVPLVNFVLDSHTDVWS